MKQNLSLLKFNIRLSTSTSAIVVGKQYGKKFTVPLLVSEKSKNS